MIVYWLVWLLRGGDYAAMLASRVAADPAAHLPVDAVGFASRPTGRYRAGPFDPPDCYRSRVWPLARLADGMPHSRFLAGILPVLSLRAALVPAYRLRNPSAR